MAEAAHRIAAPEEVAYDPAMERRLDALLSAAEAALDRPVGVAGRGSLDLMCALWRRGFQRVEAARWATCGCADERCDLLLISGGSVEDAFATVEATRNLLSAGGRLAVTSPDLRRETARHHLCNLLAQRGFRYLPDAPELAAVIAFRPELDT
jgi:hypothetical protein